MNIIIPALTLGFIGSFHCIGMCGPIALSLPIYSSGFLKKISSILLYNFGRALTYSLLGLIFGIIGQTFSLFGFQQYLSITVGILVLFSVFFTSNFSAKHKLTIKIYTHMNFVKTQLAFLFKKKGRISVFGIGLLNGLLPCGLVYMGIAGALATGSYLSGAAFMAVFGLATIPVMVSISLFGNIINLKFRQNLKKVVPIILSVMALLLILRGLNLGLPYFSPKIQTEKNEPTFKAINCHK